MIGEPSKSRLDAKKSLTPSSNLSKMKFMQRVQEKKEKSLLPEKENENAEEWSSVSDEMVVSIEDSTTFVGGIGRRSFGNYNVLSASSGPKYTAIEELSPDIHELNDGF